MATKPAPLDLPKLADRVRELLHDLPCDVKVDVSGIEVRGLTSEHRSDDADQRRPLYADLHRQGKSRAYYASSRGLGWQITNGGGYGAADTRTFGSTPEPEKLATSIAEVARRRAATLTRWAKDRENTERATQVDIETSIKVATLLGIERKQFSYSVEDAEKRIEPEHGTGRVRVVLKGFYGHEVLCWPDEIRDAARALKHWQGELATFGHKREG